MDPTTLPRQKSFSSYAIDAQTDMHLTVQAEFDDARSLRIFTAEEPDAVHVLVAHEPKPVVEQPLPDGIHQGWAMMWMGPVSISAWLKEPLGKRRVIDQSTGRAARRMPEDWAAQHAKRRAAHRS